MVTHVDPRIMATARSWLLDSFARDLAPGESILRTVDTYHATGHMTLEAPVDPGAVFLFREPLKIEPGGITQSIAYLKVRERTVRDVTLRDGRIEEDVIRVLPAHRERGGPPFA